MQLWKNLSACILFASAVANAAVVSELAPYPGGPFGQQSDANTPIYVQSTLPAVAATLTSISWWGYHGIDSAGAANDDFVVMLNGSSLAGALSTDTSDPTVQRYTLTISPWVGIPATIAVANQGVDIEWYWQSAASIGGAHATDVSYRLEGANSTVSIENTAVLLLAGFTGLAVARRGIRRTRRG